MGTEKRELIHYWVFELVHGKITEAKKMGNRATLWSSTSSVFIRGGFLPKFSTSTILLLNTCHVRQAVTTSLAFYSPTQDFSLIKSSKDSMLITPFQYSELQPYSSIERRIFIFLISYSLTTHPSLFPWLLHIFFDSQLHIPVMPSGFGTSHLHSLTHRSQRRMIGWPFKTLSWLSPLALKDACCRGINEFLLD